MRKWLWRATPICLLFNQKCILSPLFLISFSPFYPLWCTESLIYAAWIIESRNFIYFIRARHISSYHFTCSYREPINVIITHDLLKLLWYRFYFHCVLKENRTWRWWEVAYSKIIFMWACSSLFKGAFLLLRWLFFTKEKHSTLKKIDD